MIQDPIVKIDLHPIHVPFKEVVREQLQRGSGKVGMGLKVDDHWLGADFLICRMTTESGLVGVGESYVWLVESAVSPKIMADVIEAHLARFVLGRSAFDVGAIHQKFANNVARNEMAKGVLDMALYDIAARSTGRPAHDLCGGRQIDRVPLSFVMPLTDIETIESLTQAALEMGFRSFRCKLGDGITRDVAIVEAVRALVGPDAGLRVDYNQAYSPSEALAAIQAIAPYGIDFAEQPVRSDSFAGMAWVQARTSVPLMAHEAAFGMRDIFTLAEMGAVRCFGLNAERPGGMTDALRAVDYAAARGLDVVLHNQCGGIGSAMLLHLHAARAADIRHATELQGHLMLESTLIEEAIDYDGGTAVVPQGAGWGVTLDMAEVDRFQTHPTVTAKG